MPTDLRVPLCGQVLGRKKKQKNTKTQKQTSENGAASQKAFFVILFWTQLHCHVWENSSFHCLQEISRYLCSHWLLEGTVEQAGLKAAAFQGPATAETGWSPYPTPVPGAGSVALASTECCAREVQQDPPAYSRTNWLSWRGTGSLWATDKVSWLSEAKKSWDPVPESWALTCSLVQVGPCLPERWWLSAPQEFPTKKE